MNKSIFSNFRGNLFGGITAGIVALPLALAFGVQSGLAPMQDCTEPFLLGFLLPFLEERIHKFLAQQRQ